MKQKALAIAIKRIVWANVALTAAVAGTAYAQTAPAVNTGASAAVTAQAAAPAAASDTAAAPAAAAPAAASAPAATTQAAPAASNGVQKIKRFEVTGSLIRQADKTGFQQVQVATAKDIQASGATSVSDFLRDTSANSASSWGDNYTFSTAPGGAGIALRGLSEKYTLVLVDGQRMAPYALNTNFTDSFFDLNSIPLNDVDRIEIVKTGAVSQYGSDAIAGVVNIITKHDFHGLQLDGSLGGAQDGGAGTTKFNILGGVGSLASDGWNITAAGSFDRDSGVSIGERNTTANQQFPLGSNQPMSYWVTPNGLAAPSTCAYGSRPASTANNITTGFSAGGTGCSFNDGAMTLAPENEHVNLKVHADFKINDNTQAFADVSDAWTSTRTVMSYASMPGLGVANSFTPSAGFVPQNNAVSASNPYNPYGVATPINYMFPNELQASDTTSNFWSFSTGVKGSLDADKWGNWDWATTYAHSQSMVAVTDTNEMYLSAYQNILNGGFDFANPSATPNGLNGAFGDAPYSAISKLDVVDATISTPDLFHLPTGDVGLGLGAQFQHQSEFISDPTGNTDGTFSGPFQSAQGERNVAAVYYQFDIPIVKNLTFSQSGRYDHYSDFGGAFSPRFALRYQPFQALTAYASYNRGFRAPTLVEDTKSTYVGVQNAIETDPADSTFYGQNINVQELTHGNPDLQPERTKNYNLGFELSPTHTTDIGFDWYRIAISNVIGIAPLQPTIDINDPAVVVRNPNGTINYVNSELTNFSSLTTDGFEATFRQALPTSIGTFTLNADWAYVWHFQTQGLANGATDAAGNNSSLALSFGGSFPRWKGNTSLAWQSYDRKWNAALSWQYTGPYANTTMSGLVGVLNGVPATIGSYSQFNLTASYTGFKHWTLYGGIDNIFNRAPSYDPNFISYPYYDTGYDTSLNNFIGRYAYLGATYKF